MRQRISRVIETHQAVAIAECRSADAGSGGARFLAAYGWRRQLGVARARGAEGGDDDKVLRPAPVMIRQDGVAR